VGERDLGRAVAGWPVVRQQGDTQAGCHQATRGADGVGHDADVCGESRCPAQSISDLPGAVPLA
jgi:hypothetical protein